MQFIFGVCVEEPALFMYRIACVARTTCVSIINIAISMKSPKSLVGVIFAALKNDFEDNERKKLGAISFSNFANKNYPSNFRKIDVSPTPLQFCQASAVVQY